MLFLITFLLLLIIRLFILVEEKKVRHQEWIQQEVGVNDPHRNVIVKHYFKNMSQEVEPSHMIPSSLLEPLNQDHNDDIKKQTLTIDLKKFLMDNLVDEASLHIEDCQLINNDDDDDNDDDDNHFLLSSEQNTPI